jgi:hypothetical protein
VRLLSLVALFAAGMMLAGVVATVGGAQTTETTTETVHHTTTQTVTQPTTTTTTLRETTTVQQTTTAAGTTVLTTVAPTTTSPATTTSAESASSGTPTWVWVLLALLGAAVVGLAAVLISRRDTALPDSERRQRLHVAIASWAAQGWALVSETTDSAVLQRGDEQMMVNVDPSGQIVTRPMTPQPPHGPPPEDRW